MWASEAHQGRAPHHARSRRRLTVSRSTPEVHLSIGSVADRMEGEEPARRRRHRQGGHGMKQYLLSIYQPDGDPPPPEVLDKVMADVNALVEEIKASGTWVFNGGLHPPSTATVVRVQDGEVLTTDGPFAEGKEHVGGFWVIQAPDLDAALDWGRKATRACAVPVEVRPFQDEPEG